VFVVGVFFLSIWVFISCSLGRRWMLVSRECVLTGVWFGRSCDVTCPVLISIFVYDESVSNLWHFLTANFNVIAVVFVFMLKPCFVFRDFLFFKKIFLFLL
jgi:hypothetical protein